MINWLFGSRTARQAGDMCKHVRKIFNAQRDILSPQALTAMEGVMRDTQKAIQEKAGEEGLKKQMANLEAAANKWFKPYPNAGIRENVEVLLVALAVAMGIRTFFAQPFKIPTGSMQPTLFGITSKNLKGDSEAQIPGVLARIFDGAVRGTFYHYLTAEDDGELVRIGPVEPVFKFIHKASITMRYPSGEKTYQFWCVPEDKFGDRAGIEEGQKFQKGEEIVKFRDLAGDHLFVDRVTYNFRRPTRGEIIVFETRGIDNLPQDQFYIKRMVAMGGDQVQIGSDRHLIINGKRLDKTTPHFENVYSFNPQEPPLESHYSGHVNQFTAGEFGYHFNIAPLFPDQSKVYSVTPDHYMVMGDNTMNSYDSRAWGDFPQTNVIGKYFFVYWPFSQRFGWGLK
jgi:signal peptidase I